MEKRLNQIEKNRDFIVNRIVAPNDLKNRLISFGILKGAKIRVLDHTLKKETWEIECEGTKLALRDEEIASIFVKENISE